MGQSDDLVFFTHYTNSIPSVLAVGSAFVLAFGLVSYIIKEKVFVSDSLMATLWGIAFGPIALNVINPKLWGTDVQELVFYFSDLVINIQIMAAAVSLPRRFWKSRWKSLGILLGPVTIFMWLSTAIVFHFFMGLPWIQSLLLASTCAPTDPVLANSIVNGRFAELHINKRVRDLLSGESAANDGVVLPFFELGIFLLKFPVGEAFSRWSYFSVIYVVFGGLILGTLIGLGARYSLRYSEQNGWIDKNNFLVFELALAVFTGGLATMLHIASFIAVLVAGIVFSWDGWFTEETAEAHVQEVIDNLLNIVFFIFFGTIIPWSDYGTSALPIWKLLGGTFIILFVRRLPAVLTFMKLMRPILTLPEAVFVGWFGPIGVGALWYQTNATRVFPEETLFFPIVSFIVLISVICHGITVPFVHLSIVGYKSRTLSRSQSNIVPRWPTGVSDVGSLQISGPSEMVQRGDGSMVPASQIQLQNPSSPTRVGDAVAMVKENSAATQDGDAAAAAAAAAVDVPIEIADESMSSGVTVSTSLPL